MNGQRGKYKEDQYHDTQITSKDNNRQRKYKSLGAQPSQQSKRQKTSKKATTAKNSREPRFGPAELIKQQIGQCLKSKTDQWED